MRVNRFSVPRPQLDPMSVSGPDLSRKLSRKIQLKNGAFAELRTLADAAQFIARLPIGQKSRLAWTHAASLIRRAASKGRRVDIVAATLQMERALFAEGWLR
jgi:hypothetical protein